MTAINKETGRDKPEALQGIFNWICKSLLFVLTSLFDLHQQLSPSLLWLPPSLSVRAGLVSLCTCKRRAAGVSAWWVAV